MHTAHRARRSNCGALATRGRLEIAAPCGRQRRAPASRRPSSGRTPEMMMHTTLRRDQSASLHRGGSEMSRFGHPSTLRPNMSGAELAMWRETCRLLPELRWSGAELAQTGSRPPKLNSSAPRSESDNDVWSKGSWANCWANARDSPAVWTGRASLGRPTAPPDRNKQACRRYWRLKASAIDATLTPCESNASGAPASTRLGQASRQSRGHAKKHAYNGQTSPLALCKTTSVGLVLRAPAQRRTPATWRALDWRALPGFGMLADLRKYSGEHDCRPKLELGRSRCLFWRLCHD